jgi:hypothetical protein
MVMMQPREGFLVAEGMVQRQKGELGLQFPVLRQRLLDHAGQHCDFRELQILLGGGAQHLLVRFG